MSTCISKSFLSIQKLCATNLGESSCWSTNCSIFWVVRKIIITRILCRFLWRQKFLSICSSSNNHQQSISQTTEKKG